MVRLCRIFWWLLLAAAGGESGESQQERLMNTKLAKQIAKEVKRQNPSAWWSKLWTPNMRK